MTWTRWTDLDRDKKACSAGASHRPARRKTTRGMYLQDLTFDMDQVDRDGPGFFKKCLKIALKGGFIKNPVRLVHLVHRNANCFDAPTYGCWRWTETRSRTRSSWSTGGCYASKE